MLLECGHIKRKKANRLYTIGYLFLPAKTNSKAKIKIMKKISALLVASLLVLVFSASAQRVILNSQNNYEISIDGRNYNGNTNTIITDLAQGTHTLQVYQVVSNGILGIGKKRNLISSQQFMLRNYDVNINVDQYGRARIDENGGYGNNGNRYPNNQGNNTNYPNNRNNYPTQRDRRDDDHDRDYDHRQNNGGKYGNSEGKGKGHKYGHYKNKYDKKNSKYQKKNNGNNRRGNN